jgi:hypothetical protein
MMIVDTETAIIISPVFSGPVVANDLPPLRFGLWKFQHTDDGQKSESTKCTSPTEDMEKMNATLEKSGCRFSPVKKPWNVYTFTANCSMKMPSGAAVSSRSTSALTVEREWQHQ